MLRELLLRPLAMRDAVTYQRDLVDSYRPNQSSWLGADLAVALEAEGRMRGQQPAGTYARKVLEPFLIDLSWSSSRLEGNRYTLLDTKNPIEAAFFLWVNLAYLQPFEVGNKRTSRLAANIPLMLYNCSPLSFLDVGREDYALAMRGVYEQRDMAMAADVFTWVYRRSIAKYGVMLEAMGVPDPVRLQYRELLNEAINAVVREGVTVEQAMDEMALAVATRAEFAPLLRSELEVLGLHNCARYRLPLKQVKAWIDAGPPGGLRRRWRPKKNRP